MEFKIDTKEKFTTITPLLENMPANITVNLENKCRELLDGKIKNVILNFNQILEMDLATAQAIVKIRMLFYERNASFVICELKKNVQQFLDKNEFLETLNFAPTESEAWDIVQMEEIEREYLDDDFPG